MSTSSLKNRRISVLVLFLVLVGVILNHLSFKNSENGPLLVIDEREVDVLGEINNRWTSLVTDCSSVKTLNSADNNFQAALKVVQDYSPPQSRNSKVASVWVSGSWLLVESEFEELLPAVVPLKKSENGFQVVQEAVWSGYTRPWKAAPFIRQYISKQASEMPLKLLSCFNPQSNAFR